MFEIAIQYVKSGLSIIPADQKTKKPRLSEWGPYMKKLPNNNEILKWFDEPVINGLSIAIITGAVSSNLETIDFDCKGEVYGAWAKIIYNGNSSLFKKLIIERSQSGGYHVFFRCNTEIPGNTKLATKMIKVEGEGHFSYKSDKKYKARIQPDDDWYIFPDLIETRGEGGYVLVAPSPGYEIIQNNFNRIPLISNDERKFLLETSRRFNEVAPVPKQVGQKKQFSFKHKTDSTAPWDDYNSKAGNNTILELLTSDGWQTTNKTGKTKSGTKTIYLSRPGKNPRKGHSGSIINGNIFYCFSSNAHPFEGGG